MNGEAPARATCENAATEEAPAPRRHLKHVEPYTIPAPPPEGQYRWQLDVLEYQWEHSPAVVRAGVAAIATADHHRYPQPDDLTQRLVKHIALYCGVKPENVLLTAASDSALKLIVDTYCDPDEGLSLVPVPTYPHMLNFLDAAGANYASPRWDGELSALCRMFAEPHVSVSGNHPDVVGGYDVVYLCSPGMPLGYEVNSVQIATLAAAHPSTMFVVDEAYYEYGSGQTMAPAAATARNVIVTRTFSKGFGLAAYRIGYVIAHPDVIANMRRVHNEKSVTTIAKTMAMAALDDVEFYQSRWREADATKNYLRDILFKRLDLSCALGVNKFVYNADIRAGNFYSLYARDPAWLTTIFRCNGLLVRDKHKDVADMVRIVLGPRKQAEVVLDLVAAINAYQSGNLFAGAIVYVDLDNTLRTGSHPASLYKPGAAAMMRLLGAIAHRVLVVTNNSCESPVGIHKGLRAAGILIDARDIITPLVVAAAYFAENNLHPFVVGPPEVRAYLADQGTADDCDCVFIASRFHLALDGSARNQSLVELCRAIATAKRQTRDTGKPILYVAEEPDTCSVRDCGDTAERSDDGDTLLPDLGAYVQMLKTGCRVKEATISFGKPGPFMTQWLARETKTVNLTRWALSYWGDDTRRAGCARMNRDERAFADVDNYHPSVVVGDGDSDRQLADALGCPFVGIDYTEGGGGHRGGGSPYIPSTLEELHARLERAAVVPSDVQADVPASAPEDCGDLADRLLAE